MARASAAKLASKIEELQAELEDLRSHEYDDLLSAINRAAVGEKQFREIKIAAIREAMALHKAGNGPERQQIASAGLLSRNALYYPPYKD